MNLSRQMGILPLDALRSVKVTLIGVGGIGCPTALTLSEMGIPELRLFDDDVVKEHNLPTQIIFRKTDIGRLKVEVAKEVLQMFTDVQAIPIPERFDGSQSLAGIVVSAVDKMDWRRVIWEKVRYNIQVPFYVEARMAGEMLRIYSLSPTDPDAIARYEKTLYTSAQAVQQPCTQKAIIYTVMVTAGLIGGQVKKWLVGDPYKLEIYFDLKNMIFMVE